MSAISHRHQAYRPVAPPRAATPPQCRRALRPLLRVRISLASCVPLPLHDLLRLLMILSQTYAKRDHPAPLVVRKTGIDLINDPIYNKVPRLVAP